MEKQQGTDGLGIDLLRMSNLIHRAEKKKVELTLRRTTVQKDSIGREHMHITFNVSFNLRYFCYSGQDLTTILG